MENEKLKIKKLSLHEHFVKAIDELARYCEIHEYAFNGNFIYKKTNPMYYSRVDHTIDFFVRNIAFDICPNESVSILLSHPNKFRELCKITCMPSLGFKQFNYNRNSIAFSNGYFSITEWNFYSITEITTDIFAKIYYDIPFNPDWLSCEVKYISTPVFDSLWESQSQDEILVCYGLLGQLHYPLNDNNFRIAPLLKGSRDSAVSLIISTIRNMFPLEKVQVFEGKTPKIRSLISKHVLIDEITKNNYFNSMGIRDFKSLISGESMLLHHHNNPWSGILNCRVLLYSYDTKFKKSDDIERRLAVFNFLPMDKEIPDIDLKLQCETPMILMKTLVAYREIKNKYSSKVFEDWI
jgi:hypothetical protein